MLDDLAVRDAPQVVQIKGKPPISACEQVTANTFAITRRSAISLMVPVNRCASRKRRFRPAIPSCNPGMSG